MIGKFKTKRNVLATAALAALASFLVACSGGNADVSPTPTTQPTATTAPVPSPTTPPAPTPEPSPTSDVIGDDVVENGDSVAVHYEGTLVSGEIFDESRSRGQPLEFTMGLNQMIPGFERAVSGMKVGDVKTVEIEPLDAYGERREELIVELPREGAPEGLQPGDAVRLTNGATVTIVEIRDEVVVVDANHPLAGETLTFEIELMSIEKNAGVGTP